METKLHLIRGKRIETQLNDVLVEASSVRKLSNNIKTMPTKKREHATSDATINKMTIKPFVSSNAIQIHSVVSSVSGQKYETVIMFRDIKFEQEGTSGNVTFTGSDDEEYHMQKIILASSNVMVKCGCMDFYHRFSRFNAKDTSLYGPNPPPYIPKTDRPSDNKQKVPGVCKHLLKSIENLRSAGMII